MALNTTSTAQRLRVARKTEIKEAVQNLVDIYRDNWLYIIEQELKDQVSDQTLKKYQFLMTRELNLLKRVTNELSIIYKENPQRRAVTRGKEANEDGSFKEVEKSDENYELSQDETEKNEALKQINRYVNLTNQAVLKVCWRNQKLDYDVLLFNNVEVYSDPNDWKNIIAYKFYHGLALNDSYKTKTPTMKYDPASEGPADGMVQQYSSAVIWCKEDIPKAGLLEDGTDGLDKLKGGKIYNVSISGQYEYIDSEEDIPYLDRSGKPILPFVLFNKTYPIDRLLDFTSGSDLFDLNISIAILMIWLNSVEKYQSFKQIVFNTDNPDGLTGMVTGPAEAIVNPTNDGNGSVSVLDLQANTDMKMKAIKDRIMNCLAGYGISPENFSMSATPMSGFALKISNIGKLEMRQEQLPLYRRKEKELFEVERIIWNYHNINKPISWDAELMTDFVEPHFPMSADEEIKKSEFELTHNLITEVDLLMKKNPDLTEDEAEEIINENKKINKANNTNIAIRPIEQPTDAGTI